MKKIWMILLAILLTTGLVLTSCDNGTTTKKKTTTPPSVVEINVDLTAVSGINVASNLTQSLATGSNGDFTFDAANQFLLFAVEDDDIATIQAASKIEIEITATTDDSFRYGLGNVEVGSEWNYTNLPTTFNEVVELSVANAGTLPKYVLIQIRPADTATSASISIDSITIYLTVPASSGGTEPPAVPDYFINAGADVSKTATAFWSGNTSVDATSGIISFDNSKGSGGFGIPLPQGLSQADTVTVTYAIYVEAQAPKLTWKQVTDTLFESGDFGGDSAYVDGASGGAQYIDLQDGGVKALDFSLAGYADNSFGYLIFQSNNYENAAAKWQLKISSVVKKDDGGGTGDGGDTYGVQDDDSFTLDPTSFVSWYGAVVTGDTIAFTNGGAYTLFPDDFDITDYTSLYVSYTVSGAGDYTDGSYVQVTVKGASATSAIVGGSDSSDNGTDIKYQNLQWNDSGNFTIDTDFAKFTADDVALAFTNNSNGVTSFNFKITEIRFIP